MEKNYVLLNNNFTLLKLVADNTRDTDEWMRLTGEAMSEALNCSRPTAVKMMNELLDAGLVVRKENTVIRLRT